MALLLVFLPVFGLGEETASTEADRDRTTTTVPDPTGAHETGLGTWTWRRATGESFAIAEWHTLRGTSRSIPTAL